MNKIVNLTQHFASDEQVEEGVFNLEDNKELKALLTFNTPPTRLEMQERAEAITALAVASGAGIAMLGAHHTSWCGWKTHLQALVLKQFTRSLSE